MFRMSRVQDPCIGMKTRGWEDGMYIFGLEED